MQTQNNQANRMLVCDVQGCFFERVEASPVSVVYKRLDVQHVAVPRKRSHTRRERGFVVLGVMASAATFLLGWTVWWLV